MTRIQGNLTHQVVLWTQQTVLTGRYLVGLYRQLQDDKQASAVLEVMAASESRAARFGWTIPYGRRDFGAIDETASEAQAWEDLLEAQMGFCAFHAIVDSPRGAMRTAERAYRRAVRGLETAFPAELTEPKCEAILGRVSTLCADLVIQDLGDEGTAETRGRMHASIEGGIRQGFARTNLPRTKSA